TVQGEWRERVRERHRVAVHRRGDRDTEPLKDGGRDVDVRHDAVGSRRPGCERGDRSTRTEQLVSTSLCHDERGHLIAYSVHRVRSRWCHHHHERWPWVVGKRTTQERG